MVTKVLAVDPIWIGYQQNKSMLANYRQVFEYFLRIRWSS